MTTDKTLIIVYASKLIEGLASAALALLLDIDLTDSKTLGNKSSAFSFKQKLDLLTDLKVFNKKELLKFQKFTEIRNQFVHNFNVEDFETCFSFLDGAENYLIRQYPEISGKQKSHEDYLFDLFKELFNDILSMCKEIMEAIKSKIKKEVSEKVTREMYERLIFHIKVYAEKNPEFEDFYNRTIDQFTEKRTSK